MNETASAPSISRRRNALIAVVTIAVLAIGGVILVRALLGGGDPVMAEAATDAGPDPFTDSVAAATPADFGETVVARVAELTSTLDADPIRGVLTASGGAPGLYGGTRNDSVCDAAALGAFLADDDAKAAAWAGVHGLEPAEIPDFLESLTPVQLTSDTLVTNHGYAGGAAAPRQSVLQRGTAVLVDTGGMPVVRCSCGNPLAPAAERELASAEIVGDTWEGFDAAVVLVVVPGGVGEALTLTDLATGGAFDRAMGAGAGRTWLAVSAESGAYEGPDPSGTIFASRDGASWEPVLETEPLSDVATSPTLAVAVGSVIHTSSDGRDWSEPIEVIDHLTGVAHGDGTWIAVGDRTFAEEGGAGDGSQGAIYRSSNGSSWSRVATTSPYENADLVAISGGFLFQSMVSVAHGDGLWIATAIECAESPRVCLPVQFTSTTGTQWTRSVLDADLDRVDVAHDGASWGFVGLEPTPDGAGAGVAGTSADGVAWDFGPTAPGQVRLVGLSGDDAGWLAVEAWPADLDADPVRAVHRSADLQTWEQVGSVDASLQAVAVFAPVAQEEPAHTSDAGIEDVDFGNLTWQYYPFAQAEEPVPVTLIDGEADVDGIRYYLSEEIAYADANGDGLLDAAVAFHAYGGGNAVDTQWYVWLGSEGEPEQVAMPIARSAHCSTYTESVSGVDDGFEVVEVRRGPGEDAYLSCAEPGTDHRTRTVSVSAEGPSGEPWPVQIAPSAGFGGICPTGIEFHAYPVGGSVHTAPSLDSAVIGGPGEISESALETWPIYEQFPGWTLRAVYADGGPGCGWLPSS